jgi:hypothetical protein
MVGTSLPVGRLSAPPAQSFAEAERAAGIAARFCHL